MIANNLFVEAGNHSCLLVRPITADSPLIPYQLEILMRHRPGYLLPGYIRYRGSRTQFCHVIAGKKPVDEAMQPHERCMEIGRPLLAEIVGDLADAMDHLLPPSQFALHPSFIYVDPNHSVSLVCWPMRGIAHDRAVGTDGSNGVVGADGLIGADGADDTGFARLYDLLQIWCTCFQFPQPETDACRQALQEHGLEGLMLHLAHEPVLNPAKVEQPDAQPCASFAVNQSPPTGSGCSFQPDQSSQLPADLASDPASAATSDPTSDLTTTKKQPATRFIKWILLSVAHILAILMVGLTHLSDVSSNHPIMRPLSLATAVAVFLLDCAVTVLVFKKKPPAQTVRPADKVRSYLAQWSQTESQAKMPGDQEGQTMLLSANPADFRMAMLAEGKPGTPDENEGLRAFILVDEFIIGRDSKSADLVLPDPGVGRLHARIIRRAGSFLLSDLGSKNGTCLDGKKLLRHEETLLPDYCIIQFADRAFLFSG